MASEVVRGSPVPREAQPLPTRDGEPPRLTPRGHDGGSLSASAHRWARSPDDGISAAELARLRESESERRRRDEAEQRAAALAEEVALVKEENGRLREALASARDRLSRLEARVSETRTGVPEAVVQARIREAVAAAHEVWAEEQRRDDAERHQSLQTVVHETSVRMGRMRLAMEEAEQQWSQERERLVERMAALHEDEVREQVGRATDAVRTEAAQVVGELTERYVLLRRSMGCVRLAATLERHGVGRLRRAFARWKEDRTRYEAARRGRIATGIWFADRERRGRILKTLFRRWYAATTLRRVGVVAGAVDAWIPRGRGALIRLEREEEHLAEAGEETKPAFLALLCASSLRGSSSPAPQSRAAHAPSTAPEASAALATLADLGASYARVSSAFQMAREGKTRLLSAVSRAASLDEPLFVRSDGADEPFDHEDRLEPPRSVDQRVRDLIEREEERQAAERVRASLARTSAQWALGSAPLLTVALGPLEALADQPITAPRPRAASSTRSSAAAIVIIRPEQVRAVSVLARVATQARQRWLRHAWDRWSGRDRLAAEALARAQGRLFELVRQVVQERGELQREVVRLTLLASEEGDGGVAGKDSPPRAEENRD